MVKVLMCWVIITYRPCLVIVLAWILFALFVRHKKTILPSNFFRKKTTKLLYPLEPVRAGDVAEELRGHRAALGDKHIRAGLEVIEQVDTVGGGVEGRAGEDGHLANNGEVGVDDTEATKGHHSGGHGALSDGVHRGEERNLTREAHERETWSVEKLM
jgi:hypothetical protein